MAQTKTWSVSASAFSRNTYNPIRTIIQNIRIVPNPDKPMIALSIGDPTVFGNLSPPKEVTEAVQESIKSQRYNGYSPISGCPEAREAIAEYSSGPGVKVSPEDIVICNGCSCALDLCITVLANPGQNILVACPGFSMYQTLAGGLGVNVKTYKLLPDQNWEIDLDDLDHQIDQDTVAIVINNPSNPCGSVYTAEHLSAVLEVAKHHRVPIIADEIYEYLVFPGHKYHPLASLSTDVPILSCSGLTKRFLTPGWRIGWIVIHDRNNIFGEEIRDGLEKLSTRMIGSNTLVQGALPKILKDTPESFFNNTINSIHAQAKLAFEILSEVPGLNPSMPQGSMYMMVGIDKSHYPKFSSAQDFVGKLISEESVFCLPGECFGYPNYIRLTTTVPMSKMQEACHRIGLFCSRHCNKLPC